MHSVLTIVTVIKLIGFLDGCHYCWSLTTKCRGIIGFVSDSFNYENKNNSENENSRKYHIFFSSHANFYWKLPSLKVTCVISPIKASLPFLFREKLFLSYLEFKLSKSRLSAFFKVTFDIVIWVSFHCRNNIDWDNRHSKQCIYVTRCTC